MPVEASEIQKAAALMDGEKIKHSAFHSRLLQIFNIHIYFIFTLTLLRNFHLIWQRIIRAYSFLSFKKIVKRACTVRISSLLKLLLLADIALKDYITLHYTKFANFKSCNKSVAGCEQFRRLF